MAPLGRRRRLSALITHVKRSPGGGRKERRLPAELYRTLEVNLLVQVTVEECADRTGHLC
jgi:hypothetical protein